MRLAPDDVSQVCINNVVSLTASLNNNDEVVHSGHFHSQLFLKNFGVKRASHASSTDRTNFQIFTKFSVLEMSLRLIEDFIYFSILKNFQTWDSGNRHLPKNPSNLPSIILNVFKYFAPDVNTQKSEK